jgi:hypothetical protein
LQVFVANGVRQIADVKFIAHGDSSEIQKNKAMGSRKHNKLKTAAVARETDRSPDLCRVL